MAKIGSWSTSAGSNTATPPDGWPEGMAPSGVNDAAREMMAQIKTYANDAEWFDRDWTPTYVNANSFTVTGDRTGTLVAGRALKLYDASTIHRFVQSASFTAVTTIALESGTAITSSLTSFAVAALNPVAPSKPQIPAVSITIGVPRSVSAATTVIYQGSGAGAVIANTFSFYNRTTGRFSPQGFAGWYNFNAVALLTGVFSATGQAQLSVYLSAGGAANIIGYDIQTYGLNGVQQTVLRASGIGYMNGSSDAAYIQYNAGAGSQVLSSSSYLQIYYLGK